MKKLLVLVIVLSLTMFAVGGVMAKSYSDGHPLGYSGGDFADLSQLKIQLDRTFYGVPTFEGWFSVEKDAPSMDVRGVFQGSKAYQFKLFQNDQTFADLRYIDINGGSEVFFDGSYLFDNNCFVGMEYYTRDTSAQFVILPGYRFNLGENGYVSLGLNYALNDDVYNKGVLDYEIKARYYGDNFKVYGQAVLIDGDNIEAGDNTFALVFGGAYRVSDNFILGGRYLDSEGIAWGVEVGCTTSFDKFGFELSYINMQNDYGDSGYNIHSNLLYSFTDKVRAGMELVKIKNLDDLEMIAKINYTMDDQKSIVFMHQFPIEDIESSAITYLGLDYKF